MKVKVYIKGNLIPQETVERWERKRIISISTFLQSKLNLPKQDISKDKKGVSRNIKDMRADLVQMKMDAGTENLRTALKGKLTLSKSIAKVLHVFSFNKKKLSVIEILVENTCTAEEMHRKYFKLMLQNNKQHDELNRYANPDHYISKGVNETVQEVIETTGGAPLPTQFFIHYGETDNLISKSDSTYPIEISGVCKTVNGDNIGGIRHLLRDEGSGFRAKLQIEFPWATPNYMIKQHQLHLACEFTNWFNSVADNKNF